MRLALNIGYSGADIADDLALLQEADRLGYHSLWAAEAYGSDVVSVLAWYAAQTNNIKVGTGIMQMPARTPAMTAMTAATLSELTGGRFLLGLGLSGPQVVEGWHGRPYGKPLGKTREYVSIVKSILAREYPVTHEGAHYQIPYRGADATGLGKPLKLILHPKHDVPVYLASIGPKNVELTAEIADGWLPVFFSPFKACEMWGSHLQSGFARSGEDIKDARFDVAVSVPTVVTENTKQALWGVKPALALYIGGMGAKGRNFYYDLACRYGYEKEADNVQALYLVGKKEEAIAAVPDGLADETSLIGSVAQIRDRLGAWREAGVTTLIAMTKDLATLRALASLV